MATSTASSASSFSQIEEGNMFVNFDPEGSPDEKVNEMLFGKSSLSFVISVDIYLSEDVSL